MKIVIGSNVHWWNAEAAYAAKIASLLKKSGHIVYVITQAGSLNERFLKEYSLSLVTYLDLNTKNPFKLYFSYRRLKKFLIEEDIELINAHQSAGFPLFVLAARFINNNFSDKSIKVIRTRGTTRNIKKNWLNIKMHTEWTNFFITAGEIVKERLLQNVNVPPKIIKTIYYPIDSQILPLKPIRDYRKELNIDKRSQIFAVVGRIRPVKGQRILLKSLKKLLYEFPDLILLIIYRDTSDFEPEMQRLQRDITRLGIESNLRLIPERQDILQLMEFVDVGIVCSIESEVICRVAVEFFSVETPVVAFPTGCLPEIIRDGKNGFLTNSNTIEELSEKLKIFLSNPDLIKKMGKSARIDAENRFNPQKMLDETLKIFESYLSH